MSLWNFVTDFGDSAVTLPLALWVLICLVASGERWAAFAWIAAIAGTAVAIGLLKLVFGACGPAITAVHVTSPSGHTAMSTAVYGCLALLIAAPLSAANRRPLMVTAMIAIFAIGWSRVALHDHGRVEIVLGFIVGGAGLALFWRMLGRSRVPGLRLKWLVLGGAVLVAALHGTRLVVEPEIKRLAWHLRSIC